MDKTNVNKTSGIEDALINIGLGEVLLSSNLELPFEAGYSFESLTCEDARHDGDMQWPCLDNFIDQMVSGHLKCSPPGCAMTSGPGLSLPGGD